GCWLWGAANRGARSPRCGLGALAKARSYSTALYRRAGHRSGRSSDDAPGFARRSKLSDASLPVGLLPSRASPGVTDVADTRVAPAAPPHRRARPSAVAIAESGVWSDQAALPRLDTLLARARRPWPAAPPRRAPPGRRSRPSCLVGAATSKKPADPTGRHADLAATLWLLRRAPCLSVLRRAPRAWLAAPLVRIARSRKGREQSGARATRTHSDRT